MMFPTVALAPFGLILAESQGWWLLAQLQTLETIDAVVTGELP